MRKTKNTEVIEGYLYQHNLEEKTVTNKESKNYGQPYISGTISIATDEELENVIEVHYTYVTPTFASGKPNRNYNVLKQIIDGAKTVISSGKDVALKVKAEPAISLNEWYDKEDNLVSLKINEGGFISIITSFSDTRCRFEADMLITTIKHIEANEERNIPEKVVLSGAIFDFRNTLMPVEFSVTNAQGMEYCDKLTVSKSEPIFTKVWGKIVSTNIEVIKEEENAFGEPAITKYKRAFKDWQVTGIQPTFYDFGDESVLTGEELKKLIQDREIMLATKKKERDEYIANKANLANKVASAVSAAPAGNATGFDF